MKQEPGIMEIVPVQKAIGMVLGHDVTTMRIWCFYPAVCRSIRMM
jgi:hypothetical protein